MVVQRSAAQCTVGRAGTLARVRWACARLFTASAPGVGQEWSRLTPLPPHPHPAPAAGTGSAERRVGEYTVQLVRCDPFRIPQPTRHGSPLMAAQAQAPSTANKEISKRPNIWREVPAWRRSLNN